MRATKTVHKRVQRKRVGGAKMRKQVACMLAPAKQLLLPGLEEVPAHPGSAHTTLRVKGGKAPTLEQRVAMAKRVQERKNVGAYVPQAARQAAAPTSQPQPSEEPTMSKQQLKEKEQQRSALAQAANSAHLFHSSNAGLKPEEVKKKYEADAKVTRRKRGKAAPASQAFGTVTRAAPQPERRPTREGGPAKGAALLGRPRRSLPEGTRFRVVKDPTKTGMSKVFMSKAQQLKQFTKAQLVAATKKALENEDRAGKFFDYFVAKGALAPVK